MFTPHDNDQQERELVEQFLKGTTLFLGPDPAIMYDHGLAPITERERAAIERVPDPVISIVRSKLQAAASESFEMLEQIGAAPGAKWGDLITGIYTTSGDLSLASSGGVLAFSTTAQYAVKYTYQYWKDEPTVGIRPGDAFMHNDARYGGIHNADHSLMLPVFYGGELVAWAVAVVHEGENGAVEPGGIPSAAESKFMEGLMMSPFKVAENYTLKKDLVTFLQNSVREPKLQLQDMKAKLSACMRMKQRIEEAIADYGVDAIIATLRKTLDDTVEEVKRRLRQWPDGTVRAMAVADGTLRENILIKTNLEVTKKGDELHFNLSGSAPEFANRSNNTIIVGAKGVIAQLFLSFIWPDMPRNQAVVAPMKFTVTPKTIFDCSYEAPNAQSMMTIFPLFTAAQLCLAKFLYSSPEKYTKVLAPWYNMIATFLYGGITQNGEIVGNLCADLNGMPGGAREDADGEHAIAPLFAAMAEQGEQELIEEEIPMIQLSRRIMKDNQGFGKYRGGHGYQMMVAVKDTPYWGLMSTTIGSKYPSIYGLFGGYGCPAYPLAKIKGVNVFRKMQEAPENMRYTMEDMLNERPFEEASYSTHHRGLQFELVQEGELYILTQGAGGGYGDVLERDPELVMKDLEEGLISVEVARDIYRVVYDPDTLVLDREATERAREEERRARLRRGVPFGEFVREWVTEEPPAHLPWYGCWGDPKVVYAGSPQVKMAADAIQSIYLPDPKDVRIAELEARLTRLRAEA
ncbi:acetone carboxylase subunit alpha [Kyrpidia spormannii]|uniref:Acetone carboxylase subunit alpha n=1 Tax=Kyrpidia spormannii TaxID=2055160 RepID=A0A2K8NA87_9BACL|nr:MULTISPECIES: hydantoinase B/oxoprolinase family protein [Kyrpidia]ATY86256.1 acetone carboxylase subunit alpha [Kyrpidia spormannii]MCL6577382.1 hydantoinase B/oxoprolinase family protein [Kyrpidia sp.]